MALNGTCFTVTWNIFRNHVLEVGLTQNQETVAFRMLLFYFILSCIWTHMHISSLKLHLVEGPITHDFTLHLRIRDHTTWFWRCVGTAFGHFLLGSHNFMVTALGLLLAVMIFKLLLGILNGGCGRCDIALWDSLLLLFAIDMLSICSKQFKGLK